MAKRLLFLFSCFICCAFLSAQQIDTVKFYADYDKLVDRVNSEYVKVYCEYCMETKRYRQEDSASYFSVIRGQLDGSLSYDSLFTLLDNNNWSATAQNLLRPLENTKRNVKEISLDVLFSCNHDLSVMDTMLHAKFLKAQERLRNEIIKDYSPKKNIFDMIALYIAIGAMFMALIACGLALFMFFKIQKRAQESRNKEMNCSSNVNIDLDATKGIALDVQKLKQSFYNLQYSVNNLAKELEHISSNKVNTSVNTPINTFVVAPSSIPQQETQTGSVNLKSKDGGYLEESDGRFDFRGFNIRGNDASFEFCGRADRAIEHKDAIFGGVCICEGNSRNAQTVKSLKPGKIRLEGNGNWKVIEKAVVKFE